MVGLSKRSDTPKLQLIGTWSFGTLRKANSMLGVCLRSLRHTPSIPSPSLKQWLEKISYYGKENNLNAMDSKAQVGSSKIAFVLWENGSSLYVGLRGIVNALDRSSHAINVCRWKFLAKWEKRGVYFDTKKCFTLRWSRKDWNLIPSAKKTTYVRLTEPPDRWYGKANLIKDKEIFRPRAKGDEAQEWVSKFIR